MLLLHLIVILSLYGFYRVFEKARHNTSRPSGRLVPVFRCQRMRKEAPVQVLFCIAFLIRLVLAFLFAGSTELPGGLPALWEAASLQECTAKLPAILSDLIIALFLLKTAERILHENGAFWLLCLYLFNPASLGCSSVWGQKHGFTAVLILGICVFCILAGKISWPECFPAFFHAGNGLALRCFKAAAFLAAVIGLVTSGMAFDSLYPVVPLLLLCYIYSGDSRFFDCYAVFSVCCFYKMAYFRYIQHTLPEAYQKAFLTVITLLTAAAVLYLCRTILTSAEERYMEYIPAKSAARLPFGYRDFFLIVGICAIYGAAAFWNLGIMETPVTEYPLASGESILLDFGEDPKAKTLSWYLKDAGNVIFTLETRNTEAEAWSEAQELTLKRPFCWESSSLDSSGRYFLLRNLSQDTAVAELAVQNQDGEIITPLNAFAAEELFDEAELLPEVIDYRTGTYFDETFYTRTAYEFLNGTPAWEATHPPLGKILIAWGTVWFGTGPFGFRFMGTLLGILMLPFLYLLGRDMTGSRMLGAFGCFLFAFDFMHFTQTRITTIDVYITFFTILMFYFMYRYSRMSFYDTSLIRTWIPLGACGLSFGLGIAAKWTGFYAGAGLAVLFFRILYIRYREYTYAAGDPAGSSNGISHAYILRHFKKFTVKTILFCVVFFLAVPFVIYLLSYLPFSDGTGAGLLERMWNNQKYMLSFHTGLKAGHAYASSWYEWPLMIRPVFYYSKVIDDTMRQGISAFGNPMVWWAGIPAFFYMGYLCLKKGEKNAAFLCTAYLSCYLPWCFVSRCTFAYHYFPCVPFVACMIMYSFAQWKKRIGMKKTAALVVLYSVLALGMFVLFYPVLSGQPVSGEYVSDVLRWLDTWALVQ